MKKKIVVPEKMLKAAELALDSPYSSGGRLDRNAIARDVLKAALGWMAENPHQLDDVEWGQLSSDGRGTLVTRENVNGLLLFIFSRMFIASEPELKPCPFCGCPGDMLSYQINNNGKIHHITCTHCYVAFYPSQSIELCDFAREWNRRDVEHVGCKVCQRGQDSK